MSSSALRTQVYQALASNTFNADTTTPIYSAGAWDFKNASAVTSVKIDASGNVGVGTDTPTRKVHIRQDQAAYTWVRIDNQSSSASAYSGLMLAGFGNTWGLAIGSTAANGNALSFLLDAGNSNSEKMRIDASGNLLVGTTSVIGVGALTNLKGGGNVLHVQSTSSGANNIVSYDSGGVPRFSVSNAGAVSKASGSFKIDHPLPEMSDSHFLVHSFIEGPRADNIYRGKVKLSEGKAEINLDSESNMTEGTFVLLNRDIQCFTSNESGWTAVRGKLEGNILKIEAQESTCSDSVSWLVIGERQDKHMYEAEWTDENGKIVVEPLKV